MPHQRSVKRAVETAQGVLGGLSAEWIEGLWSATQETFARWKGVHGEAPIRDKGLLQLKRRPELFEGAPPHDCAGPGVNNEIDLAFKLSSDRYPAFLDLLSQAADDPVIGIERIFALLILRNSAPPRDNPFRAPLAAESINAAHDLLHDIATRHAKKRIDDLKPLAKMGAEYRRRTRRGGEKTAALKRAELSGRDGRIRDAYQRGAKVPELASRFGLSERRIRQIIRAAEIN